jgi:hypothetical protein
MRCRCERCCPDDPDPRLTEDHKWRCLARFVNAMATLDERRGFLDRWKDRHGKRLTDRLKAMMKEEWQK